MRSLCFLALFALVDATHLGTFKRFVKRNALKRQCPPKVGGGPAQIPLAPAGSASPPSSSAVPSSGSGTTTGSGTTPSGGNTTTTVTAGSPTPFSASGKRGLGFTKPADTHLFPQAASWGYNWNSRTEGTKPGMIYLPMLWGMGGDKTGPWLSDAQKAIDAGAPAILGFNEPDCKYGPCVQANLSPQEAAAGWRQWMHPFKGKALLISPAITNGGGSPDSPMGLLWMQQFVAACSDCQIDGFAIHIYDRAAVPTYYKEYLARAYEQLKKPLWLTEIGWSSGTDAERVAFVEDFVPWAEQQSYIAAVAIFGAVRASHAVVMALSGVQFPKDRDELTMIEAGGGKLSSLGEAYEAA